MTRLLVLLAVLLVSTAAPLRAERLLLAVLELSGPWEPAAVSVAVGSLDLRSLVEEGVANGELRAATVVFTGTFSPTTATPFAQVLTFGGQRASVSYSLKSRVLEARVVLDNLEKLGFKMLGRRTFSGRATLAGGRAVLLSQAQRKTKTTEGDRTGKLSVRTSERTGLLVAQVVP